jgi:hypothetical protein
MSHSTRLFSTIALTTTSLVSGLAWLTVAMAEPPATPPMRLSKVISLADLHDEAAAQLTLVKQHLDTKKSYADSAKHELPRAAGLLAVIGQAITEHDSKPAAGKSADRPPIHGPALRDVALKLAASKTHTQALETVPALQAVVNGRSGRNETRPRPWTGLISLDHIMEELNSRNSRLRRAVRRSRDPELDARNAATMALLAVVVAADTHEVKQKAQLPTWKKYAVEFQLNASATAAALRARDTARVKPLYLKAAKACADCHSDFRSDE